MLNPFLGIIRHRLAWWDPDQRKRGMQKGEEMGLSRKYLLSIMENEGFIFVERKRFIFGLNNLYIFLKRRAHAG